MHFISFIVIAAIANFLISDTLGELSEYCQKETFQPSCGSDEIILMASALYGRMELGRCVPHDLGYIGCRSDVLPLFDELCSGLARCSIKIDDENIEAAGGCLEGLERYLEADYECHKAIQLDEICSSTEIDVESDNILLSIASMKPCVLNNRRTFTIKAKEGQLVNISLISLSQGGDKIYGTIQDISSENSLVFGAGSREQYIMASTGSQVQVTLQGQADENNFILRFQVSGCPDISPPDGAWMIRDGNNIEIGCHSGAKSWSLKCEQNQWIGAVGLCGSELSPDNADEQEPRSENTKEISPNVLMFAGSSVIILMSAITFLTGVCILRRKLQSKRQPTIGFSGNEGNYGNNALPYDSNAVGKDLNEACKFGKKRDSKGASSIHNVRQYRQV